MILDQQMQTLKDLAPIYLCCQNLELDSKLHNKAYKQAYILAREVSCQSSNRQLHRLCIPRVLNSHDLLKLSIKLFEQINQQNTTAKYGNKVATFSCMEKGLVNFQSNSLQVFYQLESFSVGRKFVLMYCQESIKDATTYNSDNKATFIWLKTCFVQVQQLQISAKLNARGN